MANYSLDKKPIEIKVIRASFICQEVFNEHKIHRNEQ